MLSFAFRSLALVLKGKEAIVFVGVSGTSTFPLESGVVIVRPSLLLLVNGNCGGTMNAGEDGSENGRICAWLLR